jgi:hypothetical protein
MPCPLLSDNSIHTFPWQRICDNNRTSIAGQWTCFLCLVRAKDLQEAQKVAWGSHLCGGGVKYLHRGPASCTSWRKGNPVPGGITGPCCSWGIQIWGSLKSEKVKCGHEPHRTQTWEWLRWRGPAAIVNDRPTLLSESLLHMDYNYKCSVAK